MVIRMKRLTALAPAESADKLMAKLMKLRCVEVRTCPLTDSDAREILDRLDPSEEIARQNRLCQCIDEALELLHRQVPKKGLLAGMVKTRIRADLDAFDAGGGRDEAMEILDRTSSIIERMAEVSATREKKKNEHFSYLAWSGYDLPMNFTGTKKTMVILGVFPSNADIDAISTKLYTECGGAIVDVSSADMSGIYASVLFHEDYEEDVNRALSSYGCIKQSFRDIGETSSEAYERSGKEIEEAESELTRLNDECVTLAEKVGLVEILSDSEHTKLTRLRAKALLGKTESTVALSAYSPEECTEKVTEALEALGAAYEFADPEEGEDIPVMLDTPKVFKPFEMVLGIYSLPAYGTFDPTKIMAIFYAFIFGCMMADVGYGLVLVLGCTLLLSKLRPEGGMKQYFDLFRLCGYSCMLFGVLFGGWFGDLPVAIFGSGNVPYFIEHGLIPALNPMDFTGVYGGGPVNYMICTLLIGVAHIFTGMGIKFYILCREHHVFDAIFDIGSWYVLFGGIGLVILGMMVGLPTFMPGVIVAAIGVLMIVCTAGRHEKNPVMKFLKGLLGLYGIINYASDILSYSVIAMVVNMLSALPGVFVLAGIPIMIFAHLFNLALNLLGTFVHTSRLQFIEFFGRFFVDGGTPFRPLEASASYTEEENVTLPEKK